MTGFVAGGGKIDAEGFLKLALMSTRTGYFTGLNVTQRGAGANMSVDVNVNASGYAGGLLNTSSNIPYVGWIAATDNNPVSAADPTNPRIDTVVAYVDLSVISTSITDNTGALKFKAVTGTPAGSPTAPNGAAIQSSIGAGNPYITLANVAVAAAASSIVNANITDTRQPAAWAVPYLYGGASNTNGHLVPNVADDTLALLAAVQTLTNKLLSTGTTFGNNLVTGNALATNAIKLGYAEATASTSGITSEADISGLSVAVTVPAGGRDLRITVSLADVQSSTTGQRAAIQIKEGSTQISRKYIQVPLNGSNSGTTLVARVSAPSSGSHTYKATITRDVGGGTVTAYAAAVPDQSFILVEAV